MKKLITSPWGPVILMALLIALFSTVLPAQGGFQTTAVGSLAANSYTVVHQPGGSSTGVKISDLTAASTHSHPLDSVIITLQVLDNAASIPAAGTNMNLQAWSVPARFNGWNVAATTVGVWTPGSGGGNVQISGRRTDAARSGTVTFATTTLSAGEVVKTTGSAFTVATGDILYGYVFANTAGVAPVGCNITFILKKP